MSDKFTRIKGISDRRRLPRLGKIRLGVRVLNSPDKINKEKCTCKTPGNPGCFYCTHPEETDYFICPPEVVKAYENEYPDGKIRELDVMFPTNRRDIIFPQAYKWYGSSKGLKCIGNGEVAKRFEGENNTAKEIKCPCELLEKEKCRIRAHLRVILPKVSMGGIYQFDFGSANSIIDINSGIDYIAYLTKRVFGIEDFTLIPLKLKRVPIETFHDGQKQIHYTLRLHSNLNAAEWNAIKNNFQILAPGVKPALPSNGLSDEAKKAIEATIIETEKEPEEKLSGIEDTNLEHLPEGSGNWTGNENEKPGPRGTFLAEIWKILDTSFPDCKPEKLSEYFGDTDWESIKRNMPVDALERCLKGLKEELEEEELPF